MKEIIVPSDGARVWRVRGKVWKLLPDGTRLLILPSDKGELLDSGIILEAEENAEIELEPAPLIRSPAQTGFWGVSDQNIVLTPAKVQSQGPQQSQSLSQPAIVAPLLEQVHPSAGYKTGYEYSGLMKSKLPGLMLREQEYTDVYADLQISIPVTPDNVVNQVESIRLSISGKVTDIESGQPVLVTLTDSTGKSIQCSTPVSGSDWNCWFTSIGDALSGLADGSIQVRAEASDTMGNMASDQTSFDLDTQAEIRINDVDTYKILDSITGLLGSSSGIENGQEIELTVSFKQDEPFQKFFQTLADQWATALPDSVIIVGGKTSFVSCSASDKAGNIASDHLPPLGNPLPVAIEEGSSLGTGQPVIPISDNDTLLTFDPDSMSELPDSLYVHDSGQALKLSWRVSDDLRVLTGAYTVDAGERSAIQFTLPESGTGTAEFTQFTAIHHPDADGRNTVSFQIPYLKTGISTGHQSLAGVQIQIQDDDPEARIHETVTLIEGSTASWQKTGKLFTEKEAGADGARITQINTQAYDSLPIESAGAKLGFHKVKGSYGDFYVKADGKWFYTATADQVHPGGKPLEESFQFILTDYDQDSSAASIAFTVLDGKPISGKDIAMSADQECQPSPVADSSSVVFFKGSDTIVENSLTFDPERTLEQFQQLFNERTVTSSGLPLDLSSLHPDAQDRTIELKTLDGKTVIRFSLDKIATETNGDVSARVSVLQTANLSVQSTSGKPDNIVLPVITRASEINDDMAEATVFVTMVDGKLEAIDDSRTVTEGKSITGNLIQNSPGKDIICSHSVRVSEIRIDGDFLASGAATRFPPGSAIKTNKGQLTVQENGDWGFTAYDSLNHNIQQQLAFDYTVTAVDGHNSSARATFDIMDGVGPTGGFSGTLFITEPGLVTAPLYPAIKTSDKVTVRGDGSDPISAASLAFSPETLSNLADRYSSGGEKVEFATSGKNLTGSAGGTEVLSVELIPESQSGKDLDFRYKTTLYRPLDHPLNSFLNLDLTVTATDLDGDRLKKNGSLTLAVYDGDDPEFPDDSSVTLEEAGLVDMGSVKAQSSLILTPGSDTIKAGSWKFSANQPGLQNLTSLGHAVTSSATADGRTVSCLDAVTGSQVLTVTLDSSPAPEAISELGWTATLYQALDQDSKKCPLRPDRGSQ